MSVKLIKKHVDVNEMTKRESTQIVKERDMIVPDGKPDMQRVLYLDGKVNMNQIEVQQDRVVYKGQIDVTILYLADDSKDVYTMRGNIPLEDFIIVEGVDPDQRVGFEYNIEHLHWNILNERKINVKAILDLAANATKSKEMTMVTGIESEEPIQTRMKEVSIVKQSTTKEERVPIKDELTVVQGKNSIGEVLAVNTSVKEEQIKRTDNELLFSGTIEVTTLYKSQEDENVVEVVSHRVPFAGSVDLLRSDDEMEWECDLEVVPTKVQVLPDYDGEDRIIDFEGTVVAKYSTFDKINQRVVDDLYCPGKKITTKDHVEEYMTLCNRATMSTTKKDAVALPDTTPENNEIYSVQIKPMIDEKNLQDDKLTINGMLEVRTVYTNKEGLNPVETNVTMVPFAGEMKVEHADSKCYLDVKVVPKDVQVATQNRGEVIVEYDLDFIANVYARGSMGMLEEVEVVDMDKQQLGNYPSITVYVAKKGDGLWDVAKRFNTTVNDIIEINGLEDKATLNTGQKIIILKKTKF